MFKNRLEPRTSIEPWLYDSSESQSFPFQIMLKMLLGKNREIVLPLERRDSS